jgi:hypothetical protein
MHRFHSRTGMYGTCPWRTHKRCTFSYQKPTQPFASNHSIAHTLSYWQST